MIPMEGNRSNAILWTFHKMKMARDEVIICYRPKATFHIIIKIEDIFDSRATGHNNVGSVNSNQPVQFLSLTQLGKLLVKQEQDLMLSVNGTSQMFEEMLTRINGALSIVGSIHLVSDSAITHCLVRLPKKLLRVNSSLDEIISLEFTYMNELVDPNDPYRFRILIMESRLLQGEGGSKSVLYVSISEIFNNVIIPWASILNMIARLEFMKGAAMFWKMQVRSLHEHEILISSIASGFGNYTSIRKQNAFYGLIVRNNFDQHRKIFDPWDILFTNVTMEIDRIVRTIRSSFQLLNDGIKYLVLAEAKTMFDHGFVPDIHKLEVLLKDLFERGSFVTMNIVTIYVSKVRSYWVAYPNGIPEEAIRLVLIQPLSKNKYRKINRVLTELWWLQLVRFVGWVLAQQSGCLGSTLGVRKKSSKFLLDIDPLIRHRVELYNSMVEKEGTEDEEEAKKAYQAAREHSDHTAQKASGDKVSSALIDRVDAMLQKLENEIDDVDAKIGDRWRLLDRFMLLGIES
ncbi:hypothetical protein V6N11_052329 [Hibiscus sabdariffa]|uniref:Uncharacterized protein n=1 Tax=Hibiscus sabdariffa TaxID=183260 RepID=A0ABR2U9Y8_9ROSI